MSKIVFIFIALMLPKLAMAYDTATIEQVEENGIAVAAGGEQSCVLTKAEVKCWGDDRGGALIVPELSHPRQVSVGLNFACALDDLGVKCWGPGGPGQFAVPELNHPRHITAGTYHACALDDSGVTCWGPIYKGTYSNPKLELGVIKLTLTHPREVSAGNDFTCALDDSGVKCWGEYFQPSYNLPSFSHSHEISVGSTWGCALDGSAVNCWGYNSLFRENPVPQPRILHPRQLSVGALTTCVLDDDGAKCWGGNDPVPELSNPRQISVGFDHSCAVDDAGVKCWGNNRFGQLNVPDFSYWPISFDLLSLEKSYMKLSGYVYQDKKLVLENLAKTIEKFPINKADDLSKGFARLSSIYWIESVLQEAHSDFVQTKIFPRLIESKAEWSKKFGISGVQAIALSPDVLEVASTLLGSGLQASKHYLSTAQQKELEDLMLAVAQAKALSSCSLTESASQLVLALDQHQRLIAALLESERTVGIGKMIFEIQSYLKGQLSL